MDINTVKKLAQLSYLNFTDEELETAAKDLTFFVDCLSAFKSADFQYDPLKDNIGAGLNDLREDIAAPDYPMDKLLQNAVHMENCFVVPKVLE